jgi:LysR family glycine cleavage system transcriptional activator
MGRRLPNLKQLRAFEAAARNLSFKDAADELHVTHAAVSHQIKALEEMLGQPLFRRVTRGVRLTPEAEAYARCLTDALDRIETATETLVSERLSRPLRISVAPFYGNRVLMRRLPEFRTAHPEIAVEIDLDFGLVDFETSEMDAAIRYGLGDWPDLEVALIYRDVISPVCAPDMVAGRRLPLDAAEIVKLPLATTKAPESDWARWLEAAGVPIPDDAEFLRLDNRAIALDYALVGNGVAMADLRMIPFELASGSLVRLHPLAVTWDRSMYLVRPKSAFGDPRLAVFLDWLRQISEDVDLDAGLP